MRLGEGRRIHLVVLRDRAMHAEDNGLTFTRQMGDSQRAGSALDMDA